MRIEHQGMSNEYVTCFESVLITILKSMGLKDETSLLGRCCFFVAAEEGLEISPKIHSAAQEWAESLEMVHHPAQTAAELHDGIRTALERGHPVGLPVDLYSWPHTPHFEKRHQQHYVAVFGLEDSRYHVLCPYYDFEGMVSPQEVHAGYFSAGNQVADLVTLEHFTPRPPAPPEVEVMIRQSCAYMLGAAVPESLAGVDPDLLGCTGIRTFADRLEALIETHGERLHQVQGLVDLSRYLMVVGYARHWFSRLLAAHEKVLLPTENDIQRRLLDITQAWIAVGKRLAMGLHGRRNALVVHSLRRVAQLAALETDLFTALADALVGPGDEGVFSSPSEEPGRPGGAPPTDTTELWPTRAPFVAPQTSDEHRLAATFGELLGLDEVGRDDDFFQLGGDSILLIRLISKIREDFGIQVDFYTFFEAPTVAQLADRLQTSVPTTSPSPALRERPQATLPDAPSNSRSASGLFPLTPSQQDGFEGAAAYHHWNVSLFFELDHELATDVLRTALGAVLRHHEALRARFVHRAGEWLQVFDPPGPAPLTLVDLQALPVPRHRETMEAVAAELQPHFDLERAPLLRFVRFVCSTRSSQENDRFFALFHHLLVDGYSLDLVFADLRQACEQVQRGAAIRLPTATTSFSTWVERLGLYAGSAEITNEFDRWLALPWARVGALPVDHSQGRNVQESVATVSRVWDAASSRRLTGAVAKTLGVTVGEILLVGLARTLADWNGHTVQAIETFGHGRLPYPDPEFDVSRTVGFFSYSYPVVVEVEPGATPQDDVGRVAAQTRRVERGGLGYTLLRTLHPQPKIRQAMQRLPVAQAKLNYRGNLGRDTLSTRSLLRLSDENPGRATPSSRRRSALIRLAGRIDEGRLHLAWQYSRNCHERSTIEGLAARLDDFLRALVGPEVGRRKPATETPTALHTPVQEMLAQIWVEALRLKDPTVERVGPHDNFFELGGHSLLAMQVISRVRHSFQVEMPLRILFETPTVAELAEHVERAMQRGQVPAAPPLVPSPRDAPLPLSFAQERLWFLHQLAPGSAAYNLSMVLRFAGRLKVAALERALDEIQRRHEVLRTRFKSSEDGATAALFQVVDDPVPGLGEGLCTLPRIDLSDLNEARREGTAQHILRREMKRPFDLARGPAVRPMLLRLAAEDHALLVAVHHIASDGWSMSLLFRELAALYGAFSNGLPSPLAELPIQYADFAAWQRQWLGGDLLNHQLAYWKERLAGAPDVLDLPTDRPRPPVQSERGARRRFRLSSGLSRTTRELSRQQDVTLFMTLLAAFAVLLHRSTGSVDLSIGTPVAGRNRVEIESLLGVFINTLVLRTKLSGGAGESFQHVLERVREAALGAYAHQELPFEKLVDELEPERSLGHTPLFQVMFVLQNAPRGAVKFPGLQLSPQRTESATSPFDLNLTMFDVKGDLRGFVEYRTELFDPTSVVRLVEHFETLLGAAVEDPSRPLSQLPMLSAAQRHALCTEWNDTAQPGPAAGLGGGDLGTGLGGDLGADLGTDHCVHQLVAAQGQRTPEAIAVVFEGCCVTFAEFNRRADQLASFLNHRGVGPEVLVGVAVERSLAMMVALLGVLKAGGAYVPLDPSYPSERLAFMLEDAEVALLLTQKAVLADFSASLPAFDTEALCLDQDWGLVEREGSTEGARPPRPSSTLRASNAAYVIYTSGSTGRPKGVQITHRALLNFLSSMGQLLALSVGDRWLAVTSLSFDIAALELFLPLLVGGQAEVVQREVAADGRSLLARLPRAQVMQATPATWQLLLDSGWETTTGLTALCGGEALPPALAEALSVRAGRAWNLYGPTETTIWSTVHAVLPTADAEGGGASGPVAVGRPIANTQTRVLNAAFYLVPLGVAGELLLGGAGLARGYLQRPALTAQKFVPDPWSRLAGSRLYRTGDLVRRSAAGELHFLGRLDQQVKIRGFRIELGEIEAVLAENPSVRQAVVLAREVQPSDHRLIAYLVCAGALPSVDELRSLLGRKLPEYMIPTHFAPLASLPLTPNGKVDRATLTRTAGRAETLTIGNEVSTAPRSPTEEMLAEIWAEVLRRPSPVGIHQDFFALGGHSLLATQVISRVRRAFGVEIPLRTMFEARSVARLSTQIDRASRRENHHSDAPVAPPIASVARRPPLLLSFAQERLWFLDQLAPGGSAYNLSLVMRLTGRLEVLAMARAVHEIIRRHETLRTRFEYIDDGTIAVPTQVIDAAAPALGPHTLPLIDLCSLDGGLRESVAHRVVRHETQRPFHLEQGPLFRGTLLRLEAQEHVLLVGVHHIASDGWSMALLFRELATLYSAFSQALPSPLAPLPIQYADFAAWQRQWLRGETLQHQLAYWKERLAGAPTVLELPTDRPRPAVQSEHGARCHFRLPSELSQALHQLSRQQHATLFMTLFAAFAVLLSRSTGAQDLSIGTPIAGRNQVEIEPLIGFFINTLVLRIDLKQNSEGRYPLAGFQQVLEQVREVALGAYAHQEMPFEKLVDELELERSLGHTPLFQVMFVLQNAPRESVEFSGLRCTPQRAERQTSQFDLNLSMSDVQGGLRGFVEYRTELFDRTSMGRMVGHFETLLRAAAADPQRPLSQLPILSPAQRHELHAERNDTARLYANGDLCLHDLLENQFERTPEAIAVVSQNHYIAYAELNQRANQLAHFLRRHGVGPEVLVGVAMERAPEMVTALLGILKAGGAYVPLDPAYPAERLAFMLADTEVAVLLTQQHLLTALLTALPTGLPTALPTARPEVLCLDRDGAQLRRLSTATPVTTSAPENPAYAIYTSGTTGRPKGAVNSHRGIVNRLLWMQETYGLDASDRVLQKTSFSFDVSVWEFFWPLLTGARLILARPDGHGDPAYLADLIAEQRVTTLHFVPSMLQSFLNEPHLQARCGALRRVIASGEALPWELQERFHRRLSATLHNLYGPTEAAVDVTFQPCVRGAHGALVPIGRPIANLRIHLLDHRGAPVPSGAAGELHIGGVGLARGYHRRVALTAEKFVPDGLASVAGSRLYRTGDLARSLPTGELVFLGRLDHQVKVRGFRIELGEIEAALLEHPAVQQTVVVAREDQPGDRRLAAYLVAAEDTLPGVEELRRFLHERLPDYMVPASYVPLEEMPLTTSGKVDRRALPAPSLHRPELEKAFEAPRNGIEETLVVIWKEVLRLERIGIRDNFFDLGGDSILSILVVSRARKAGFQLSPRQTFQHQTIAELATVASPLQQHATKAEQGTVVGALPLAPIQHWFFEQELAEPHHFNQARLLTVQDPKLPAAILAAAAEWLIAHHDALRLRAVRRDAVWELVNAGLGQPIPFARVDLSALPKAARRRALETATARCQASLDLTRGPLVRFTHFALAPRQPARLLIVIHHLAVDGVSWRILLDDLETLCRQAKRGQRMELLPKTTSYQAWTQDLLALAGGEQMAGDASYWLGTSHLPTAALPVDDPGGVNSRGSARKVSVALTAADTEALLRQVPQAYQTSIEEVLLTALAQTFATWTAAPGVLLDLEGHGRDAGEGEELVDGADLSRTVGWFTSLYPVVLEVQQQAAPGSDLKSCKERLRRAPKGGLSYGLLRYLSTDEFLTAQFNALPRAEVLFNYLGQLDQGLAPEAVFGKAQESTGPANSPRARRSHLLEILGRISDGCLHLHWIYSRNVHHRSTIEHLGAEFLRALRELISHCTSRTTTEYTPSDFPDVDLSQEGLDRALSELEFD